MAAERLGVDSLELCTWLDCGGVTPSYGFVNTLKEAVKTPLRVLIRPGPGGFFYTAPERQVLLRDAMLIGMSRPGLVTGALDDADLPDVQLMKAVRLAAPDCEVTFHRAIDRSSDPGRAFAICLEMGVHRVLTSGARTRAIDGVSVIQAMVKGGGEAITVAAAGGIDAQNVVELVERTGVREVHFSARRLLEPEPHQVALNSQGRGLGFETAPDEGKMEGVLNALTKAGLR